MKALKTLKFIFFGLIGFLLTSCDKGYDIRFTNYYIEPMDSVIVGDNKIVFTAIELQATTGYKEIKKGKYSIECISRTKKKFYSSITIPGKGEGKRTIQIDGVNQISILEE
jgi:hypothetical protein